MKDMPVSYHRILNRLEARERRLLRVGPSLLSGPMAQLRGHIPPAVRSTLEAAFTKAFSTLFGPGGTRLVEKTYPKEKLEEAARRWEQPLSPRQARQALRRMDRQSSLFGNLEGCLVGAEGAALGLLGIGLPDIPILLAWLLRNLYQTAVRYGFSYESDKERFYLLLVLQGALSEGEERRELSRRADAFGRAIDHGWSVVFDLEAEVRITARLLADRLLLVKFIQGLPLVGVLGGAANFSLSGSVSRYGKIKYKKRFLERKVRGL